MHDLLLLENETERPSRLFSVKFTLNGSILMEFAMSTFGLAGAIQLVVGWGCVAIEHGLLLEERKTRVESFYGASDVFL